MAVVLEFDWKVEIIAVHTMDRDRSYVPTAFPPSMAVIADQARNDDIPPK